MFFLFVLNVLQVDPVVYNMLHEDPGNISYSAVGGLSDQIRELRESIELPLMNPELFIRVGIKPPKVMSLQLSCLCLPLRKWRIPVLIIWKLNFLKWFRVYFSMVLLVLERHYWREQLLAILMPTS